MTNREKIIAFIEGRVMWAEEQQREHDANTQWLLGYIEACEALMGDALSLTEER